MENNSDSRYYLKFIKKIVTVFPYMSSFSLSWNQGNVCLVIDKKFVYQGKFTYNNSSWKHHRIPQEKYQLSKGQIAYYGDFGITFSSKIKTLIQDLGNHVPSNFVIDINRSTVNTLIAVILVNGSKVDSFTLKSKPLPDYASIDKVYSTFLNSIYTFIPTSLDCYSCIEFGHTTKKGGVNFDNIYGTQDKILGLLQQDDIARLVQNGSSKLPFMSVSINEKRHHYLFLYNALDKKIYATTNTYSPRNYTHEPYTSYNNPGMLKAFGELVEILIANPSWQYKFRIGFDSSLFVDTDLEMAKLPSIRSLLEKHYYKNQGKHYHTIALDGKQRIII
jgi:hypothetical protein